MIGRIFGVVASIGVLIGVKSCIESNNLHNAALEGIISLNTKAKTLGTAEGVAYEASGPNSVIVNTGSKAPLLEYDFFNKIAAYSLEEFKILSNRRFAAAGGGAGGVSGIPFTQIDADVIQRVLGKGCRQAYHVANMRSSFDGFEQDLQGRMDSHHHNIKNALDWTIYHGEKFWNSVHCAEFRKNM